MRFGSSDSVSEKDCMTDMTKKLAEGALFRSYEHYTIFVGLGEDGTFLLQTVWFSGQPRVPLMEVYDVDAEELSHMTRIA